MSAIFLFACGSITSTLPWLNATIKYFTISKLEEVKKKRENYTKLPLCLICLFVIRSCFGKPQDRVISFQVLDVIWNSTENFEQSWTQSNCLHNSVAVWCIWVNLSNFWWHFKMHVPKAVRGCQFCILLLCILSFVTVLCYIRAAVYFTPEKCPVTTFMPENTVYWKQFINHRN